MAILTNFPDRLVVEWSTNSQPNNHLIHSHVSIISFGSWLHDRSPNQTPSITSPIHFRLPNSMISSRSLAEVNFSFRMCNRASEWNLTSFPPWTSVAKHLTETLTELSFFPAFLSVHCLLLLKLLLNSLELLNIFILLWWDAFLFGCLAALAHT